MSDLKVIEQGDPEELTLLNIAKEVGDALMKHYPNHPWLVCFQGGALLVRHQAITDEWKAVTGKEGMCFLLPAEKLRGAKQVAHSAVVAGGQMLEAFGLKRGAWSGEKPMPPRHMVLAAIGSNSKVLH